MPQRPFSSWPCARAGGTMRLDRAGPRLPHHATFDDSTSGYQSGLIGRNRSRRTLSAISRALSFERICAAPKLLMQTSRTPPSGRFSSAEMPIFLSEQCWMISASVIERFRARLIWLLASQQQSHPKRLCNYNRPIRKWL